MASNPMQEARNKFKKLVEMDKRLANGEIVSKAEFDYLIGDLRHASEMAIAYGIKIPVLGSIGGMTSQRIDKAIKRAQDDINNPKLFTIHDGFIKRVDVEEEA